VSWGYWLLIGWAVLSLPLAIVIGKYIAQADRVGRCTTRQEAAACLQCKRPDKT